MGSLVERGPSHNGSPLIINILAGGHARTPPEVSTRKPQSKHPHPSTTYIPGMQ